MYDIMFEEAKSMSYFNKFFLYFEYYKLKFGFWISTFRTKSKIKDVESIDLSYEDKI